MVCRPCIEQDYLCESANIRLVRLAGVAKDCRACDMPSLCAGCTHCKGSALQEVEKEVWEKDAGGKRKLRVVQETGYKYEEEMEGESWIFFAIYVTSFQCYSCRRHCAAMCGWSQKPMSLQCPFAALYHMHLMTCCTPSRSIQGQSPESLSAHSRGSSLHLRHCGC